MTLREEVILDTLGLAHQYGFQDLEVAISDILKRLLALKNVCAILDTAHLYGLDQLVKVCHSFMDEQAAKILQHESFLQLSEVRYNFLGCFSGQVCSACFTMPKNVDMKKSDGKRNLF